MKLYPRVKSVLLLRYIRAPILYCYKMDNATKATPQCSQVRDAPAA